MRVDVAERVDEEVEVVPAQVAHGLGEGGDGQRPDERRQLRAGVVAEDAVGQLGRVGAQHPLVLLVGHRLEPAAQVGASGALEEGRDRPAPRQGEHLPARGLEHPLEAVDLHVRHHTVERLAVDVDHPQHLAEPGDGRVGDGLPHGTLVELRVADEADEPSCGGDVGDARVEVAVRERGPDRGRRADAECRGP